MSHAQPENSVWTVLPPRQALQELGFRPGRTDPIRSLYPSFLHLVLPETNSERHRRRYMSFGYIKAFMEFYQGGSCYYKQRGPAADRFARLPEARVAIQAVTAAFKTRMGELSEVIDVGEHEGTRAIPTASVADLLHVRYETANRWLRHGHVDRIMVPRNDRIGNFPTLHDYIPVPALRAAIHWEYPRTYPHTPDLDPGAEQG